MFCVLRNIKVFHKLILLYLVGVVNMPKLSKITSYQCFRNEFLGRIWYPILTFGMSIGILAMMINF